MKKPTVFICSFEKESLTYVFKKGIEAIYSKGLVYVIFAGFNRLYKRTMRPFLFFRGRKSFIFDEKRLKYFCSGDAAFSERVIEIPLITHFLRINKKKIVLEIGNVLNSYKNYTSYVVDKYEKAKRVINEDIIDYNPKIKCDVAVSISTLEHVGWDERPKNSKNFLKAIKNIRKNCLKKGGQLIFTVPLGYNTYMDYILKHNKIRLHKKYFFKRISLNNQWILTSEKEAFSKKYNFPYECANAIMLGILQK
ncbi:hypothetical protein JW851_04415 [Candidatus Woesearchaeota archaeon]|nr:hypothetical protein [Candidatus Woesearchaeota archaeon]